MHDEFLQMLMDPIPQEIDITVHLPNIQHPQLGERPQQHTHRDETHAFDELGGLVAVDVEVLDVPRDGRGEVEEEGGAGVPGGELEAHVGGVEHVVACGLYPGTADEGAGVQGGEIVPEEVDDHVYHFLRKSAAGGS